MSPHLSVSFFEFPLNQDGRKIAGNHLKGRFERMFGVIIWACEGSTRVWKPSFRQA